MVTKWWNKNGWTYIFIGCTIIIFFLWIFIAGKEKSSSYTNLTEAMNMIISPQLKSSISVTKDMFREVESSSMNNEFIYENGTSKGENECRRIVTRS